MNSMKLAEEYNSVKPSKKTPQTFVSSIKVFLKYVHFGEGTIVDVSEIFSQQCFLEWLETRPGKKIKHPSRSFQRVLYAHIRGADNRKPFPEAVEQELLRVLRDVDNNPWQNVFVHEKVLLGKRGFKSFGFHEASSSELFSTEKFKRKDQLIRKRRIDELFLNEAASWKEPILNVFDPISLEETSKSSNEQSSNTASSAGDAFGVNSFFKYLERPPSSNNVPWDLIKSTIQAYVPAEKRQRSLIAANKRGLNFWSPALYFYLNQAVDPEDFRFSWRFLCPRPEEQKFRVGSRIGTIMHSTDKILTHEDIDAMQMFGGSVLNMHLYEIFASHVSLVYSFIKHIPDLYSNGIVWRRDVILKPDKSRMVCLIYTVRCGANTILYIEDQSDLYPEILKKVYLI